MRALVPALLLATLAAACSDHATAPRQPTPALSADFLNNPDVGNGVVYRYGTEFAICWTDFSNGLRVCHRTKQFPGGECGIFDPIGGISEQDVIAVSDPNDFFSNEVVANVMGNLWITVRDLTQPGNCYGARRVAEGWGSFHYTDNDVLSPFNPGDKSSDAFGYMAQGTLTASDGSPVLYNGHSRFALHPDGTVTAFEQVVHVH